jgi:hypothetical protein
MMECISDLGQLKTCDKRRVGRKIRLGRCWKEGEGLVDKLLYSHTLQRGVDRPSHSYDDEATSLPSTSATWSGFSTIGR